MNLYFIGSLLWLIISYIYTIKKEWKIIKRNKLVSVTGFGISLMLFACNLFLSVTEYIYLSAGFTSGIAPSIPFLLIKWIKADSLEKEKEGLMKKLNEKKQVPVMIGDILHSLAVNEQRLMDILDKIIKRAEEKKKQNQITDYQLKEIKSIKLVGDK